MQFNSRRIWLTIHLYLALILGFWIALLGLAGSLSIYGDGLDKLLNPQLSVEHPQGAYQPLERIMAAVRKAHPERDDSWTLEMPRTASGMITAWYERPRETADEYYAPLMVSVNPYTAEVVASRFWGETATTWLSDLHTQLLLGEFGWYVVGCLGLALIISLLSGLYLWWPGFRSLRQAFTLRYQAKVSSFALDIHRWLGLLSAIILLFLAFTGFNLAFPQLSETLVGTSGMGHDDEGPTVRSSSMPNDHPTTIDQAVLVARGPFAHADVRRVTMPEGATGTYRVSLRQDSEINQKHPMTTVWVDRYSGQIRSVRNPARFSDGEKLLAALWPVHTGEALSTWARFGWFIAGLAPAILYVTGLLRWLIRRGWVKDFTIDYTPLRRGRNWTATRLNESGKVAYTLLQTFTAWAVIRIEQFANKTQRYYQEVSKKREPWW